MTSTIQQYQLSLDTKPIKEYTLSLKESHVISNVGGFQSTYFDSVPDVCKELFTIIDSLVPKSSLLTFMWFNINRHGDYNKKHWHFKPKVKFYDRMYEGSSVSVCEHIQGISGVYYVDVPEKNMGNIVFYHKKDVEEKIEPKTNTLFLFSNKLPHSVEPNQSHKERISIAFNYGTIIGKKS